MSAVRREFYERPTKRYNSPARNTPSSIHNGMIFPNGLLHTGGKQRTNVPRDHNIIAPEKTSKPTELYPALKVGYLASPSKMQRKGSPARVPSASVASSTGRKHFFEGGPEKTDTVIRHDLAATVSPSRIGKATKNVPPDNYIIGVSTERATQSPTTIHRGLRHLDGPPKFEPAPFQKRAISPQLKPVLSSPRDNHVFGGGLDSPARSSTPLRSGRARVAPSVSRTYDIITGK